MMYFFLSSFCYLKNNTIQFLDDLSSYPSMPFLFCSRRLSYPMLSPTMRYYFRVSNMVKYNRQNITMNNGKRSGSRCRLSTQLRVLMDHGGEKFIVDSEKRVAIYVVILRNMLDIDELIDEQQSDNSSHQGFPVKLEENE